MRQDIEIIPADNPKKLSLGWMVSEIKGVAIVNYPDKHPMYSYPVQAGVSRVPCPECGDDVPWIIGHSTTLMGYVKEPPHDHDPNTCAADCLCHNGHEFSYTYKQECPAAGCNWGVGSVKVCRENGQQ